MYVRGRGATWVSLKEVMESGDGRGMGGWFNSVWNTYHKLMSKLPRIAFSSENGVVLVFFSGLILNYAFIIQKTENDLKLRFYRTKNRKCDIASYVHILYM